LNICLLNIRQIGHDKQSIGRIYNSSNMRYTQSFTIGHDLYGHEILCPIGRNLYQTPKPYPLGAPKIFTEVNTLDINNFFGLIQCKV
jgi:hypothetical protein